METCTHIDAELLKAAEEGTFEPFKDYPESLDSLLSPNKNTILHIHLSTPSERSSEFIKGVLSICPPLLWKVNVHGDTPLHIAAREMLRMINKNKETALHEAARNKRSLGVVKAIMSNEDPNEFKYSANYHGETPLYLAVKNRNMEIAFVLLIHPDSECLAYGGPNGKTALHEATVLDFEDDDFTNKTVPDFEDDDLTIKDFDINNYEFFLVDFLPEHLIQFMLIYEMRKLTKEIDEKGWTPLHYAVYTRKRLAVKFLLDIDISSAYIADKDWKRTALHIAACRGFQYGMEEIISVCPNICEITDIRGWNVIHCAVISKNDEVLKAVLKNSSLIYLLNEKDVKGNTPVHLYKACHPRLPSFIQHGDTDMFKHWRTLHKQIQNERDFPLKKEKNVTRTTSYPKVLQDEILKLMTELGTGPLGEISNTEGEMRKEKMIHKFEKVKDSHLVAAALIATVTFAAAFTVPGGYISDENDLKKGTPILSKNWTFKAFIVSDTIAMDLGKHTIG
ncbi:hypothetical protein P3X46_022334 [Hevea brasiliensis]|uniref:PGG domain-containing protein n=1 Tax=Hevea brasiliensis TaxID=3981 RepID=A0ABQ9L951_HEVBR|nr:hypothetical protein P3X46_022334 [Hevea brasiliensis]